MYIYMAKKNFIFSYFIIFYVPDFSEDFRSDVGERSADCVERMGDERCKTEVAQFQ